MTSSASHSLQKYTDCKAIKNRQKMHTHATCTVVLKNMLTECLQKNNQGRTVFQELGIEATKWRFYEKYINAVVNINNLMGKENQRNLMECMKSTNAAHNMYLPLKSIVMEVNQTKAI